MTVTETRLDLPSRGTRTVILVALQDETVAVTVPNLTTPALPRPLPVIVTLSLDSPSLGDNRLIRALDGVVGGTVVAGTVVAGTVVAGTVVAGTVVAGTVVGGTVVGGTVVGGTVVGGGVTGPTVIL
jgi:hypothetical protein